MDKIIRAKDLFVALRDDVTINGSNFARVMDHLKNMPAVDTVEVVYGRWLYDSGRGKYFCSACDEDALSFKKDTLYGGDLYEVCLTDYCPACGAKMEA